MKRKSWDEYFIDLAKMISTRATCDRLHVGCVIVKDNRVLATGYNGSISGMPHCDEVGHDIQDNHCQRVVHAEMNAITISAKNGVSLKDSTIYLTHSPCWLCFKLLVQAGVARIVYKDKYKMDARIENAVQDLNICLEQIYIK